MTPRSCTVTAVFERYGRPVPGLVRFIPSRLWVVVDGTAWACLAPEVVLNRDGSFVAEVTATDSDAIMWSYLVRTPAGDFPVYVPWNETGWSLRELVDEHPAGARTQNG